MTGRRKKRIVLVGGGHAHAIAMTRWQDGVLPKDSEVILVEPNSEVGYSGMLPGYVAGHYARSDLMIDLESLALRSKARLLVDRVIGVNADTQTVELQSGSAVGYDILSLNIGLFSSSQDFPFADVHTTPLKPLNTFIRGWENLLANETLLRTNAKVIVIGAGIAGIEMALAMQYWLKNEGSSLSVMLVERSSTLLPETPSVGRKLHKALQSAEVDVMLNSTPSLVSEHGVALTDGWILESPFVVLATGGQPNPTIDATDLSASKNGFFAVSSNLLVEGHDNIFAVGDCADFPRTPRPKAGVYAIRAGAVLADNIEALCTGKTLQLYKPQSSFMKLVSLGEKAAILSRGQIALEAPGMWKLKDHIDRSFMARLKT